MFQNELFLVAILLFSSFVISYFLTQLLDCRYAFQITYETIHRKYPK